MRYKKARCPGLYVHHWKMPTSAKSITVSATDELSEDYDLILCQEVFPHVAPSSADAAIANFCRHTCDVLFSSPPGAPVDQSPKASLRTVPDHGDTRDID